MCVLTGNVVGSVVNDWIGIVVEDVPRAIWCVSEGVAYEAEFKTGGL